MTTHDCTVVFREHMSDSERLGFLYVVTPRHGIHIKTGILSLHSWFYSLCCHTINCIIFCINNHAISFMHALVTQFNWVAPLQVIGMRM